MYNVYTALVRRPCQSAVNYFRNCNMQPLAKEQKLIQLQVRVKMAAMEKKRIKILEQAHLLKHLHLHQTYHDQIMLLGKTMTSGRG